MISAESKLYRLGVVLFSLSPIVFILYLYFPSILKVTEICMENDDYSHGVLLPFISMFLVYIKRDELNLEWKEAQKKEIKFSFFGLLLLIFGMFLYIFSKISGGILFFYWCSLFLSLIGVLFLIFGAHSAKILTPLVFLLFMARPIPDSLVPLLFNPLQVVAAKVSAWVLRVMDVPVYVVGNIIEIPGMKLLVEEACSGMRSVMALLTVSIIVSYLVDATFIGYIILAIVSVSIAVFFNVIRVALTGILSHFVDPEMATGFFHEFTGMVVFVLGLILLYSLTFMFSFITKKKDGE